MKKFYSFAILAAIVLLFSSCKDDETLRKAIELHTNQLMKGAEYVGSETCATCHDKEMKQFKTSTHAQIAIPWEGVKVEGCEMCHGPGSLHVDAAEKDKKATIINPNKSPEMCYACHADKKAEFMLPYHHPVPEGHMSCTDCHNPHGEARPWSATSLEGINEKCAQCHKEQSGPFVWEHEGMREGCTTCHAVHGSVNDKMLVARDSNLCLRCHTQQMYPNIGNTSHTAFLSRGPCFSGGCHTAVHGSNFDEHLRY